MRLLISPNLKMENAEEKILYIAKNISKYGMQPCMLKKTQGYLKISNDNKELLILDSVDDCDMVVALGGDGTIFHSAFDALEYDKPVLGINGGRLGFLSQMEINDLTPLEDIAQKNYRIERRLVLEALIETDKTVYKRLAINDIVFSRESRGRIIDLDVSCNDEFVGRYRADGLIFATPTGSTAYSLSAGGPIVDPSMDCIVFTPICSHSVFDRSILFNCNNEISISHKFPDKNDRLMIIADGNPIVAKGNIKSIKIRMSQKRTGFVCIEGRTFFRTFNQKFK